MGVPVRVLGPKLLARYMERHRLLDETSGTAPDRFLITLLRRALEFVPCEGGALLLDDPVAKEEDRQKNELTVVVSAGSFSEDMLGKKARPVDGIAGFVYARGELSCVNEALGAAALSRALDASLSGPIQNVLSVPVMIENHVCGALVLVNRLGGGVFDPRDERLMELFVDTMSLALQNLLDERRAREVARRDGLTALFNDRYFHKKLQQEIDRVHATKDSDLVLLFLDCDHLKSVNDIHGHLAGSQVLREVAYVMQRALTDTSSIACRYGGDEFTVVLQGCDLAQGCAVAERIRLAIADWVFLPMSIGPGEPALNLKGIITMSVGVSSYRVHATPGKSPQEQKNEILKAADTALYGAKARGKNCVVAGTVGHVSPRTSGIILKTQM